MSFAKLATDGSSSLSPSRRQRSGPRRREVAHFLCQPCFDGGKKVVLAGNGDGYWWCPVCKHGG